MIKKISKIISLVFFLAMVLVACGQKRIKIEEPIKLEPLESSGADKENEKNDKLDKEEDPKKEAYSLDQRFKHPMLGDDVRVVKVNYFHDQILDSSDYTYVYSDGRRGNEETVFSTNFDLDGVILVGMTFDGNNLLDSSVVDAFSLKAGESILLNIAYPEGIPMYKLKWSVDGKQDDYVFQYNGKDGMREELEFHY